MAVLLLQRLWRTACLSVQQTINKHILGSFPMLTCEEAEAFSGASAHSLWSLFINLALGRLQIWMQEFWDEKTSVWIMKIAYVANRCGWLSGSWQMWRLEMIVPKRTLSGERWHRGEQRAVDKRTCTWNDAAASKVRSSVDNHEKKLNDD